MPNNYFQGYSLHAALFMIILIEAVAARFYGIDRLGLWSDEIWAVSESSQRTLAGMLDYIRDYESHPPGHYILLRVTQFLLGNSAFAVRLPSALFGVVTVVIVYHLGRRYFSSEAGLIASALIAGSFQNIYFSQEARSNIIVSFFILLSAHSLYQIVSGNERSTSKYIYYWLSATAACYLHYVGLVVVLCQVLIAVVMLLVQNEKLFVQAKVVFKVFFPIVLLQLPWLPGLYHQLTEGPREDWQVEPDLETIRATLLFIAGNDSGRLLVYLTLIAGFFVYLFWLACRRVFNKNTSQLPADTRATITFVVYLIALMALPVVVFFIKSRISQPVYNSRHFIYIIPLLALYVGYVVSLLIRHSPNGLRSFLLVGLVGTIIVYQTHFNISTGLYNKSIHKEDYRGGVEVVVADKHFRRADNTAIIATTSFWNHYLKRLLRGRSSDLIYTSAEQIGQVRAFFDERHIAQFYYLGSTDQSVTKIDDIAGNKRLLAVAQYYHPVCRTKLHRVHVIKFRGPAQGAIDYTTLPLCPYQ